MYAEIISYAVENARDGKWKCKPQRWNLKWFFVCLRLVEADGNNQLHTQITQTSIQVLTVITKKVTLG